MLRTRTSTARPYHSTAWAQHLFAWAMHLGNRMMRDFAGERRKTLFAPLSGRVLELGPGTGANGALYPPHTVLYGVDPNPFMFPYLREELTHSNRSMIALRGRAEALAFANASMDAVISTHVLCSVDDLDVALAEILRVLKPGGRFVFLEHVAAPRGSILRYLQRALRAPWRKVGQGCRLDNELWQSLDRAGFDGLNYEHFRVPWASLVAPHIAGFAFKPRPHTPTK